MVIDSKGRMPYAFHRLEFCESIPYSRGPPNSRPYTMHEGGHWIDVQDWDIYLSYLEKHLHP